MSHYLSPDPMMPGLKALTDKQTDKHKCCPFQAPMMIPGRLEGQASIVYRPCGEWCALFKVQNNIALLSCAPEDTVYVLDLPPAEKPKIIHKLEG